MMGMPAARRDAGVDVITMSATEYEDATNEALRSLGLTYEQLTEQAHRREFSTFRAEKLWMALGGEGR